ncbi:hypothetical protein L218DRAFT_1009283 [Marasmius fiardii PR-910]|nr:hypothetical protein L218DRAFT_1009283 [Marasmius fiardii PR-910]
MVDATEEDDKSNENSKTKSHQPLPTPARTLSLPFKRSDTELRSKNLDADIDQGIAPGWIIGNTYPLKDFKANTEKDDVVTKAIEDLGVVIKEVVFWPFAHRRTQKMIECMQLMRQTAMVEDEVDAWNTNNRFLDNLSEKSIESKPGNFGTKLRGPDTSLVIRVTLRYGGTSTKTEDDVVALVQ